MERIAIIADDLTGANDTGIQFCKYGLKTVVVVDYQGLEQADKQKEVWSINADTRPLTIEAAYERVFAIAKQLKEIGFTRFYKKIDSTLRGHPGAELEAAMDALQVDLALVVPAFPANGRLMANGNMVFPSSAAITGKRMDGLNHRMETSGQVYCHVPAVLKAEMKHQIASISLQKVRRGAKELARSIEVLKNENKKVVVIDATTEEDLAVIACATTLLPKEVLVAGAAGLAAHLPVTWGLKPPVPDVVPANGVILLVAGTRNPITAVQVEKVLALSESAMVEVMSGAILAGRTNEEVERVLGLATSLLTGSKRPQILLVVVDSLLNREEETGLQNNSDQVFNGKAIATALGEITSHLVVGGQVQKLIMTGGDTAVHICHTLGTKGINLISELLPGIPLGEMVDGAAHGLQVVTKAGGFGSSDAFVRIFEYLKNHPSCDLAFSN